MLGIINWGTSIDEIMGDCKLLVNQTRNGSLISPVSVLLEGMHVNVTYRFFSGGEYFLRSKYINLKPRP